MSLCPPSRCGCSFESETLDIARAADGRVTIEMPDAFGEAWPNFTFADTDERDAELPDPEEGQEAFTRDASQKWIFSGGAWLVLDEPWQAYTPTLASVTLGAGGTPINSGRYRRNGKSCQVYGILQLGTTGDVTGTVQIGLPFQAAASGIAHGLGVAHILDSSAGARTVGWCFAPSGDVMMQFRYTATGGTVGASTPFDWTVNDSINWGLSYEMA